MQVQDVLKELSLGELRNLSMSTETPGEIRIADRDAVIGYINDGLTALYSRFTLRERDVLIEQVSWITNYHLNSKWAVSNDAPLDPKVPRYIKDLNHDPFRDDVVKIISVNDGNGCELPLNDRNNIFSLYTPYPDTLQVPRPEMGKPLGIVYQALHPKLEYGVLTSQVEIPTIMVRALKSFVAHKVYLHMNTAEMSAKSQEHYASYEAVCNEIKETDGANNSTSSTSSKFEKNGWI